MGGRAGLEEREIETYSKPEYKHCPISGADTRSDYGCVVALF